MILQHLWTLAGGAVTPTGEAARGVIGRMNLPSLTLVRIRVRVHVGRTVVHPATGA